MATISQEPIRYLLCGKFPSHIQASKDAAGPEFEVVEAVSTVEDGKAAVAKLVTDASEPQITFITMGGGFTQEDFEEIHNAGGAAVPWFRPHHMKPGYDGPRPPGPPPADVISARMKKCFLEHIDELKAGKGAGEIWYF